MVTGQHVRHHGLRRLDASMIKQKKRLKEATRDNRRRGAGLSRYVSTPPRTASQPQPQQPNSGVQQAVNSVPRMPDGDTSYDLNAPPKLDQSSLPSSVKACEWLNISGCIFAYSYAPSSPKTEFLDYVVPDTLPTRVRCRSGPAPLQGVVRLPRMLGKRTPLLTGALHTASAAMLICSSIPNVHVSAVGRGCSGATKLQ